MDAGAEERLKLFSVLHAVADDHICLIDVDLSTERETQFFLQGQDGAELPRWSDGMDYTSSILSYARMVVSPEDRERFIEATRLPLLRATLAEQKEFFIEYDALVREHRRRFQGRFVLGERDGVQHIYVGIRDISATLRLEQRSREEAENARYQHLLLS